RRNNYLASMSQQHRRTSRNFWHPSAYVLPGQSARLHTTTNPRLSRLGLVLTLSPSQEWGMRSPRGRHGAVEDRPGRPATDSIAMRGRDKVVELHEAERAAVQGDAAGEVVAPEDHPPMLGENLLLQALHEAIGPRVAGLDARLADAQPRTGRRKIGLE